MKIVRVSTKDSLQTGSWGRQFIIKLITVDQAGQIDVKQMTIRNKKQANNFLQLISVWFGLWLKNVQEEPFPNYQFDNQTTVTFGFLGTSEPDCYFIEWGQNANRVYLTTKQIKMIVEEISNHFALTGTFKVFFVK